MADVKLIKRKDGDYSQLETGDTNAIAHGGTGATTASGARTNLDVQQANAKLTDISGLSLAKGDLLVYDGTNVNKLSVGTDGQVIAADSGEATGLNYVDVVSTPESTVTANNGTAGAITKGQPVFTAADGDVELARANSGSTSLVLGLVQSATVASGAAATIQTDGPIDQATGAWDALTGGTGGLTPGAIYAVSTATAGSLVEVSTVTGSGNLSCPCLLAVSATRGKILDRPRTWLTE